MSGLIGFALPWRAAGNLLSRPVLHRKGRKGECRTQQKVKAEELKGRIEHPIE